MAASRPDSDTLQRSQLYFNFEKVYKVHIKSVRPRHLKALRIRLVMFHEINNTNDGMHVDLCHRRRVEDQGTAVTRTEA